MNWNDSRDARGIPSDPSAGHINPNTLNVRAFIFLFAMFPYYELKN
jgi:hypothetical protein